MYLERGLKIPPNKRFFESLGDMLRRCLPALVNPLKMAEVQYKFILVQGKLGLFKKNVFAKLTSEMDQEFAKINEEVMKVLKTAQLPS